MESNCSRQHKRTCLWHRTEALRSFLVFDNITVKWYGYRVSQITSNSTVCLTACSSIYQTKHQISASLAFCERNHHWTIVSHYKGPAMRNTFPSHGIIMIFQCLEMICFIFGLSSLVSPKLTKYNIQHLSFRPVSLSWCKDTWTKWHMADVNFSSLKMFKFWIKLHWNVFFGQGPFDNM